MYIRLVIEYHIFCRFEGEEIRLMLWDTAGQEEFDAITKTYYRGIHPKMCQYKPISCLCRSNKQSVMYLSLLTYFFMII